MDSLDLLHILVQKTSAVPGMCLLVIRVRRGLIGSVTYISAEDLSSSWHVSFGYQGQMWTHWICYVY